MDNYQVVDKFCKAWEERALLSFCLRDSNFLYSLMSTISINDFIDSDHRILYSLLLNLQRNGISSFDIALVCKEAKSLGVLESIGGVSYLKSLYNMSLSKDNFKIILAIVMEASTKYKLFNKLEESSRLLVDSTISSADFIGKLENDIFDISFNSNAIEEPKDLHEGLMPLIESRKDIFIPLSGLSTGYSILDKQIDGLIPGTLNIIAARKKMGKSAFLTNIALYVSYTLKIPVLYVDTEMSYNEFRDRAIASLTGVKERTVKHGGYDDDVYRRIRRAGDIISSGYLFHERMPGYTVERLVALYKKFKLKHNIGLAIFDYIKEPNSSSVEKNRQGYQILGDVTTKLKDLAGTLDIPFLTAVQLSRELDVADSDRIARYADVIAHWTNRTEEERKVIGFRAGSHKLIIKDTRRGGGTCDKGIGFNFFKDQLRIKEVSVENQLVKFTDEVVNDGAAEYPEEEDLI